MMIRNTVSALLLLVIMGVTAQADTVALNHNYPDRYVVVKGDTLWDISARFLRDPWKWPDVWEVNPQIKNPNLIYPGDIISLVFRNGKPVLQLERAPKKEPNVVKLEPKVRATALERAIPTLPTDAIQPFLLKAQTITPEESKNSGYIVSMEEERLIGGSGNKVYARHLKQNPGGRFEVVRVGRTYRNPGSNDVLGYEALHIADARATAYGDPSTLTLLKASREVLVGDRILPVKDETPINYNFLPSAPDRQIQGKIIALFDAVSRVGQYQVVVLNQGFNDGLKPGHVLAVYKAGATIRDTVEDKGNEVTLPDSRSGLLMVFRVFDKVSYGLIMSAQRAIHLYDMVRNP